MTPFDHMKVEAEREEKDEEITDLRDLLRLKDRKITRLSGTIARQAAEIRELRKDVRLTAQGERSADKEVERLRKENAGLKEEVADLESSGMSWEEATTGQEAAR